MLVAEQSSGFEYNLMPSTFLVSASQPKPLTNVDSCCAGDDHFWEKWTMGRLDVSQARRPTPMHYYHVWLSRTGFIRRMRATRSLRLLLYVLVVSPYSTRTQSIAQRTQHSLRACSSHVPSHARRNRIFQRYSDNRWLFSGQLLAITLRHLRASQSWLRSDRERCE